MRSSGNRSRHLGQLGEVALDVDRQLVGRVPVEQALGGRPVVVVPDGEVQVLGEGDRRQPERDRPLAGPRASSRSPGCPTTSWVCTWLSGRSAIASLWILPRRPQPAARGPFCRSRLPTVVAMSTAAPTYRAPSHDEALGVLRELTGRPDAEFREGQDAAVAALVERSERALVVQRTGWGKSAVYFVSTALLRRRGKGPTLLVSPLLALMRDQVAAAARAGIRAVEISSANMTEWDDIAARLAADDVDVLLVSPERLTNPRFREEQLPGLVAPLRPASSSTRRTASPTGGTTSAPTTAASATCWARCPPARRCWPPPRPPTSGWSPTSPSSWAPVASR